MSSVTRSESRTRKALSLILCALILGISAAGPLMERGGFSSHPAAESEHDPATCPHQHDHRICTQVGANLSLTTPTHDYRVAQVVVDAARGSDVRATTERPQLEGPPARAPPLA